MVEDGGLYTCTAKNRAGQAVHAARLNIYGRNFKHFFNNKFLIMKYPQKRVNDWN